MIALNGMELQGILGVMIPLTSVVGGISLGFAGFYMRYRERMEMISRGMDPSKFDFPKRKRSPLRAGLIVLGAGLGLLFSYLLCNCGMINADNGGQAAISGGCIATFIGLGLILSHMLEKKEPTETDKI